MWCRRADLCIGPQCHWRACGCNALSPDDGRAHGDHCQSCCKVGARAIAETRRRLFYSNATLTEPNGSKSAWNWLPAGASTGSGEALDRLRLQAPDTETINYTYIVDDQRKLLGVVTLRELIFTIGAGIGEGRDFKAVQLGGPSGGCIAADGLDMSIDYDSLVAAGTIMGSGGVVVLDDRASMVEVARYFMGFCKEESCGKCIPCRVGTAQMHDLLNAIVAGTAGPADLALLERLCDLVKHTSLCGLGQSAPNSVLSTLRSFRHEYVALIQP